MPKKKKSIITEYEDISAFSGAPAECDHHCVFGRGLRELADQDGLWIPLTNAEHNMSSHGKTYQIHENHAAECLSKMVGQLAWEKNYYRNLCTIAGNTEDDARKEFRKRYGISYL